jgi:hypothetical protein
MRVLTVFWLFIVNTTAEIVGCYPHALPTAGK